MYYAATWFLKETRQPLMGILGSESHFKAQGTFAMFVLDNYDSLFRESMGRRVILYFPNPFRDLSAFGLLDSQKETLEERGWVFLTSHQAPLPKEGRLEEGGITNERKLSGLRKRMT